MRVTHSELDATATLKEILIRAMSRRKHRQTCIYIYERRRGIDSPDCTLVVRRRRRHIECGRLERCLTHVLLGAVHTVALFKPDPGVLPFTGKTKELFVVVFRHYNSM